MKIVFFGSGKIAVPCLEALIHSKRKILCVVTAPDRQKGRHLSISSTPIKDLALNQGLNIYQPSNLSGNACLDYIKKLDPDIFVVFSYGKILPEKMLDMPKIMPINIHASLLPKYRGAAPINWALINGEAKTGITIIKMNKKMDEGDIVLKNEIDIEDSDSCITLEDKLSKLAVKTLRDTLKAIESNKVELIKQDVNMASYAPKLKKEDGRIDWNKSANQIRNHIRGCLPWPGSFTLYRDNLVKIWDVEVASGKLEKNYHPGEIISFDKKGILTATKDKALLIKELQPSSGKRLDAWQFVQGHKVESNSFFK
ncbi:methionyl-tRNA formyltransferase [Candidatus Omnitrophota bacterium]